MTTQKIVRNEEERARFLGQEGDDLLERITTAVMRAYAKMPYGTMTTATLIEAHIHQALCEATCMELPPSSTYILSETTGPKPQVHVMVFIDTTLGPEHREVRIELTPRPPADLRLL